MSHRIMLSEYQEDEIRAMQFGNLFSWLCLQACHGEIKEWNKSDYICMREPMMHMGWRRGEPGPFHLNGTEDFADWSVAGPLLVRLDSETDSCELYRDGPDWVLRFMGFVEHPDKIEGVPFRVHAPTPPLAIARAACILALRKLAGGKGGAG